VKLRKTVKKREKTEAKPFERKRKKQKRMRELTLKRKRAK